MKGRLDFWDRFEKEDRQKHGRKEWRSNVFSYHLRNRENITAIQRRHYRWTALIFAMAWMWRDRLAFFASISLIIQQRLRPRTDINRYARAQVHCRVIVIRSIDMIAQMPIMQD